MLPAVGTRLSEIPLESRRQLRDSDGSEGLAEITSNDRDRLVADRLAPGQGQRHSDWGDRDRPVPAVANLNEAARKPARSAAARFAADPAFREIAAGIRQQIRARFGGFLCVAARRFDRLFG